jgi:hypothetical protein
MHNDTLEQLIGFGLIILFGVALVAASHVAII